MVLYCLSELNRVATYGATSCKLWNGLVLFPKTTMKYINIGLAVVVSTDERLLMIPKTNSSLTSNDPCFPDQMDDLTPEKYSSALSKLVFAWLDPLIFKGWKKQLDRSDLWSLRQENRLDDKD